MAAGAVAAATVGAPPALAAAPGVDADLTQVTQRACPSATATEYARHGVAAAAYQGVFDYALGCGFQLHHVDGYDVQGKTYYNAIWRRSQKGSWSARHGLDGAAYQAAVTQHKSNGDRLVYVDAYPTPAGVRYAAIFDKSKGAWVAYHGLSQASHQKRFDDLTARGYHPRSVSVVSVGGHLQYTALYHHGDYGSWVLNSTVPAAKYQAYFNEQVSKGRYLASLQAYRHAEGVWFAAVFSSAVPPGPAAHGTTAQQHQKLWQKYTSAGYRTDLVTGYEHAAGHRYAASWKS